jgi:Domain of unknown function (DUF6265)
MHSFNWALIVVAGVMGPAHLGFSSPRLESRPDPTAQSTALRDLAWLSGARAMVTPQVRIEESWGPAASNMILGMSRTVRGDRVVEFEFLRIEARGDTLFYVAQPNGQPPIDFRLTKWDGTEAVFENPAHDFPKRILYRRLPDGGVAARVDGGPGTRGQDFQFRLVPD